MTAIDDKYESIDDQFKEKAKEFLDDLKQNTKKMDFKIDAGRYLDENVRKEIYQNLINHDLFADGHIPNKYTFRILKQISAAGLSHFFDGHLDGNEHDWKIFIMIGVFIQPEISITYEKVCKILAIAMAGGWNSKAEIMREAEEMREKLEGR